MKKVFLITETDLGDNLSEILSLSGYDSVILNSQKMLFSWSNNITPAIYICIEDSFERVNHQQLVSFLYQKPCIILCTEGPPRQNWVENAIYQMMPFSNEELFDKLDLCTANFEHAR